MAEAEKISKGSLVRQVVPVIAGEVTAKRFNDDLDVFEYLVSFKDAEGHDSERWFAEGQIEVQPGSPA